MLYDVSWRALILLGSGIVVAIIVWWLLPGKRRALRAVDLISYAVTLMALGSGLFSLRHYEERWNASIDRLDVYDAIVDNGFEDLVGLLKICPDVPHTPFQPSKKERDECHQLLEYLRNQQYGNAGHWNVVPPPDVAYLTIPELKDYANLIATHVNATNKVVLAYNAKADASGVDSYEGLFLVMAIPMLAFAFGLGVARRAIDLYSDWRS